MMKKTGVLIFLLLFLQGSWALSSKGSLLNYLNQMTSMQASFSQTASSTLGQLHSTGEVYIVKPGHFRWEVNTPEQQIIVADGHDLSIYDVALSQVIEQKVSATGSRLPMLLLLNPSETLENNFHVSQFSAGKEEEGYTLTPIHSSGFIEKIQLVFKKGQLETMRLLGMQDKNTTIHFSHVRQNIKIPLSTFKLSLPKGTDIMKG